MDISCNLTIVALGKVAHMKQLACSASAALLGVWVTCSYIVIG